MVDPVERGYAIRNSKNTINGTDDRNKQVSKSAPYFSDNYYGSVARSINGPRDDNEEFSSKNHRAGRTCVIFNDFTESNDYQTIDSGYQDNDAELLGVTAAGSSENVAGSSRDTDDEYKPFSFRRLTSTQRRVMLSLGLSDFISYICLSVLGPFFPREANDKGLTNSITGWIFGVFALVQCLTTPLFGKLIHYTGSRFLYQGGLLLGGVCTICFGFLADLPSDDGGVIFAVMCFIVRIFLAIGCTAQTTASFVLTASLYPDNISFVFGITETCVGIGLMVGPTVGGLFYGLGGFYLPFAVIGGFMILVVILNHFLIPDFVEDRNMVSLPMVNLLKIPSIFVVLFSITIISAVWAMLDPMLEPHVRSFNLSVSVVGLLFLLTSASYAISSPLWGWLAEKTKDSKILLTVGFFATAITLSFLGPAPVFSFIQTDELWLIILTLGVLGVTAGLALVPSFESILDSAELAGFEENFATYASVASLWGTVYALGDFLGPALGGILLDHVGFDWAMTYAAIASFVTGVLLLGLYIYEYKYGRIGAAVKPTSPSVDRHNHESDPLLSKC
ncbi:MFS-type transporter SLC18B1-like isoform X2 [Tubulanus polymorphus]|uniref:MFS-type transporter SLC18B1-like isoform X2 n=1 Tax=Tubulanus polymorphus TaxID=672921 RepID=UPI003DA33D8B